MEAAPAAIPPKPNIAATIAIIKKMAAQRNIVRLFNDSITHGNSFRDLTFTEFIPSRSFPY